MCLDGLQEKWDENGEKISEENYFMGERNGIQRRWKNGILILEEIFDKGWKCGTHKAWYESGSIKYIHNFSLY